MGKVKPGDWDIELNFLNFPLIARKETAYAANLRAGGDRMSGTLQIQFANDMPGAMVEVVAPDLETVGRVWLDPGTSHAIDVPSEQSFLAHPFAFGPGGDAARKQRQLEPADSPG